MNFHSKYYLFCFLIVILAFTACEEEVNWELVPGENGKLVVEAILTDELRFQEVRLSQSFGNLNGPPPPVTDAEVSVSVLGQTAIFLLDDPGAGLYKSEVPFKVFGNLDYTLIIEWQGEVYTARSELSDVVPGPAPTYRQFGEDPNLLVLNNFVPFYLPNQQAMYEVDIIWSHLTGDSTSLARTYFYTFSSVDISQLVPPDRELLPFPRGSVIVVQKYGLNDEFANYLKALVIETDWTGGIFFSNPASLPSNISNGGLGFFSTCAVLTDIVIAL